MNSGLKQRLLGAVVLVCIGLILWPVLFSGGVGSGMDTDTQIPPMPEFKKFVVEEPKRPRNIDPIPEQVVETAPPTDQAPPEPPASPQSETRSKPSLNKDGLPVGWLLQVASFTESANADQLKRKLQQQGYKAFTRQVVTSSGTVERVYIGPKLTKEAFAKDRELIDKTYNVKSIVIHHEP